MQRRSSLVNPRALGKRLLPGPHLSPSLDSLTPQGSQAQPNVIPHSRPIPTLPPNLIPSRPLSLIPTVKIGTPRGKGGVVGLSRISELIYPTVRFAALCASWRCLESGGAHGARDGDRRDYQRSRYGRSAGRNADDAAGSRPSGGPLETAFMLALIPLGRVITQPVSHVSRLLHIGWHVSVNWSSECRTCPSASQTATTMLVTDPSPPLPPTPDHIATSLCTCLH